MHMHLCYLDESGTPAIPGNTSHFILAGISIPSPKWKECDGEINTLKAKYDLSGKEIHTAWIARKYLEQKRVPNFDTLTYEKRRIEVNRIRKAELLRLQRINHKQFKQTKKNYLKTEDYIHLSHTDRQSLLDELAENVSNWKFSRLFAECIDKVFFDPSLTGSNIEEQAFEQIVSRFEQYLSITSNIVKKNTGMLIHDNNPTVAKRLTDLMIKFHDKGTLWTEVTNIIETPLFVDSKLTGMVQIADLCSYSLRRYLENSDSRLFSKIFERADRKFGKIVGVRHFTNKGCKCEICRAR